ncbi:hypothetical protein GCM10009678_79240 [Actinomadura kijaniata]|uniref:CheY-like chemotaxis protein n=1 Tax=Actinomadura namibiensis TaxID=182080 RepID=A0A7W3LZ11_ACTNM|nr:CheY-like chemotaxis protein [Actinomadura namibiensis]
MTDRPRVVVADDGIGVVAEAADGEQAVAAVRRDRPDVVLMDIRMPEADGLEATRRILSAPGGQPPWIIILATYGLDRYVYAALAAGASGFLLKDVSPEHLVAAVRLVRTGDALLAPSITRRPVERFAPREHGALHRDLSVLTPRELDRARSQQRRARREPAPRRGDREDPRDADPVQARPARPRPGDRRGVRDGVRDPRKPGRPVGRAFRRLRRRCRPSAVPRA